MVTDDTDRGIRAYAWARDGRHLLYVQDTGGDENWRLYDVDLADQWARRDLTPFDGIQARIIATRKSHRDEILVGMNRDNPQLHDVYRLDLKTGELTKLIENPGTRAGSRTRTWWSAARIAPLPDGGFDLLVRDDADARLADAADHPGRRRRRPATCWRSPATGSRCWPSARSGSNTGRLVRIDLAIRRRPRCCSRTPRRTWRARCCTRTPGNRRSSMVLKDRAEYHVLDPAVAGRPEAIRALHSGDPSWPAGTRPTRPG